MSDTMFVCLIVAYMQSVLGLLWDQPFALAVGIGFFIVAGILFFRSRPPN